MKRIRPSRTVGRPSSPEQGGRNVREEFLDMAQRMFAAEGVAGTSIARISARVGVTPAMAQYYFSSREQLLDAFAQERLLPLVDSVWGDFQPQIIEGTPFVQAVEQLIDNIVQATVRFPEFPSLWLNEVMSEGGQFRKRILPYVFERYVAEFSRAFADAAARGEVAPGLNPRLVLLSILGSTLLPLAVPKIFALESSQQPAEKIHHWQVAEHAKQVLLPGLSLRCGKRRMS